MGGQQPVSCWLACGDGPLSVVIEFSHYARRALAIAPRVQLFLDLVFDQLALFFDDKNFFQPIGEGACTFRLQRPGHGDLVDAQANFPSGSLIDAQVGERLHDIPVRLAGGCNAKAGVRTVPHNAVEAIGAAIGQCAIHLVVEKARLLVQARVGPADVIAPLRHGEVFREHDVDSLRVDIDNGTGLDDVAHALEPNPAAGVAGHGKSVQPKVQIVLHVRWVQHGNHARFEDVLALMREC